MFLSLAQTGAFWSAHVIGAALAAVLVAVFEYRCYNRVVGFAQMDLSGRDRFIIGWSILAHALLLLLAPLAFAAMLHALGAAAIAWILASLGVLLVTIGLALDVRLQRMTGNHLWFYLIHLVDRSTWEWAGDVSIFVRKLSLDIAMCVAITAAAMLVSWAVLAPVADGGTIALITVTAIYVVAILGVIPARSTMKSALALERLHNSFPIHLYLFSPARVARAASVGFGVDCDDAFKAVLAPACEAALRPLPLDLRPLITRPSPPNVIVVFAESLRADFMQPQWMPGLYERSQRGLRFDQHYSISNTSDFGAFCLLYGRSPLVFEATVERDRKPQLCHTLERAGYTSRLLASATFHDPRMNQVMNTAGFQEAVVVLEGDWPTRDQAALRQAREFATTAKTPQFSVLWLMSSHYGYNYPPQYAVHQTKMEGERGINRDNITGSDVRGRYANCMRFLDDELCALIDGLDPQKNIIVITGDHGESFGEDGARFHASRLSDVQTRVPLVMLGAGVPARAIDHLTSHADVLPTLLHAVEGRPVAIEGCHGRDRIDDATPLPQLLAQQCNDSWELMLLEGGRRLSVNVRDRSWVTRVKGFCTPEARIDASLSGKPEEVAHWVAAMEQAVKPIIEQASRQSTHLAPRD